MIVQGEDIYAPVNAAWSEVGVDWQHRPLTEAQALRAARTLWKVAGFERPRPVIRPVWLKEGIRRLVHDVSHRVWRMKRPRDKRHRDHCVEQASWERAFAREAIERRWHEWNM